MMLYIKLTDLRSLPEDVISSPQQIFQLFIKGTATFNLIEIDLVEGKCPRPRIGNKCFV